MKIENVERLVATLHHKTEYFLHRWNLKQPLNHGLVLKKVHRLIKFNQKVWSVIYWYERRLKKKKQKKVLKNTFFLIWWNRNWEKR